MNFKETLAHYQKIINKELMAFFNYVEFPEQKNPLLMEGFEILKNFCLAPGKRIRPIMAIMAFRGLSRKNEKEVLWPTLSLELYHNYTLIHDDIYDEDIMRRGEPTPHFLFKEWFEKKHKRQFYSGNLYSGASSRFGVVAGFIVGQILKILASRLILNSDVSPTKKNEILNLFQNLGISDNIGQALDLYFEKENKITENDYLEMVDYKTGGLFKTSVGIGAILADATKNQQKCLRNYAQDLAVAFQIKDDLLDISVGGEKGRGVGSDIRQGKKTLLFIYALKKANQKQKKILREIASRGGATKKEIQNVIDLHYKLGAVDYCQKIANQKTKKALFWLNQMEPKLKLYSQKFFEDLAQFMFQRKK